MLSFSRRSHEEVWREVVVSAVAAKTLCATVLYAGVAAWPAQYAACRELLLLFTLFTVPDADRWGRSEAKQSY